MEFDFKIGTPVFCQDKEVGRLKFLVIDPQDETITSLVVEHNTLLSKSVVVPVCWVEKATDKRVVINASATELKNLPEYHEVEFRLPDSTVYPHPGQPAPQTRVWIGPYPNLNLSQTERPTVLHRGHVGVSGDEVMLRRGQPVYDRNGYRIGTLDHILVGKDGHHIRHLVIEHGQWLQQGENLVIPASAVESITDKGIQFKLSREEFDRLTHFKPPLNDRQLEDVIERGLQTQPQTKGQNLKVQVERGLVRLYGKVSGAVALAAFSIVRKIMGVLGIEDHTTHPENTGLTRGGKQSPMQDSDNAIANQIIEVYKRQQNAELVNVTVYVFEGVVTLSGTTRTIAGKALAEKEAQKVPGVVSVFNSLDADTAIRARVEAALAEDKQTALTPIEVLSQGGVVSLFGKVPSPEVKQAAEQVASKVRGVVSVINELEVRNAEEEPKPLKLAYYPLPHSG
ncbi:MAG: BON domain-containing protein [Chloroflexi bacterium]|nr:BON domain-containing protein [Chloroflexota bacterium]OJV88228.1 MAG: hypothetical protein BGO39_08555 [Chloroflexi bacterium 54-19]